MVKSASGDDKMELAKKLLDAGNPSEALERLKKFSQGDWRVHELIGACFHDLADAAGAAQAYFNAATTDKYLRSQRSHFSNYLFALHYLPQLDAEILIRELKIYNSLYRDAETLPPKKKSAEKISVAFISPNFCDSSAARFYEALLTDYNREKFTVTAWSLSSEEDLFTKKIRRNVDDYRDISETSFFEAAEQIHGADVLIDLGGHTEGGATLQIAAYRPARVQMCGIGYFDSTGADFIDYFIGDEFLTAHDEIFTEKIFLLRNAFAFKPNRRMIRVKKIPHKNFTFGSLNNFMKLGDEYLSVVKIILDAIPDAKIIFRDTTPLKSRQNALIERLNAFGIKNFDVRRGSDDFYSDYGEIDLILDAFPYPGGMMTALALYMGVTVLNLCGKLPHARTGADILRISGVKELITENIDDYIKKAVELAENRAKLAALTEKISIDNHKIFYKYTASKYYFYIYELLDKLCKKSPYENYSSIFHLSLYFILKILYQCENNPYLSNLDLIILNCFSLGIKSLVKQKDFPSISRIKKIYEEKYINYNNEEICEGEIICLKLLNYDINVLTAYEYVIYLTQNDLKLRELSLVKLELLIRNNLMKFIYKSSLDIAKNCITTIKEKIIFKEPKIIKKKIISSNGFCCSPTINKYSSTDKLTTLNINSNNEDNDANNNNEEIKIKKINKYSRQKFGLVRTKKLNLLNKNSSLKNSADKIYYKKNCNIIQQNTNSSGSLITDSNTINNNINIKNKIFFKKISKPYNKFKHNNFEQNYEIKKKSTEVSKNKVYLNNNRYFFDNININMSNTQFINDNNSYNNFNDYIPKENNKNYMNLFLHKKDCNTRIFNKIGSEEPNKSYFNNSFFKGVKSKIETKNINLRALTKSVNGNTNFQRYNISTRQGEGHEKLNSSNYFNNSAGSQDLHLLTNNTIGNYYIQW